MNKIFRIVWNEAAQAWVAVSELTKKHKKRASATVATAVLATVLSAAVQASVGASGGANEPSPEFDPAKPQTFTDPYETKYDDDNENYKFGLLVTDKKGTLKKPSEADAGAISVEPNEASTGAPKYKSSFLYLRENGGITIDQEGRSAKFSVNAGDGLKVNDGEGEDGKLVADTVKLTVEGGKVTAPTEENKKKLVNAGDLSSVLNDLGWKVSAGGTTSTVKSGDEVEFKGDGVTVTNTTDEHGKHIVTIKAEQPQGGAAGKSAYEIWKEANPDNATKSEGEFLASLKGEAGRKVIEGKGITATVNTDNTLTIAAKTKPNGGISAQGDGLSIDTDDTTITLKSGKVSAVTGTITAGETPSVATADANKLAKAGEVAEAIKSAKTKVVAGSGIKVTSSGNEYTVSADLPFTKNADKSISLNEEGVIRNVANGRVAKDSKDAVNGSQLHAVERRLSGNMDKLNHRIDKVGKRADAGTASAIATANLLQSYRPGLSAATAAVGEYRGQSAVAVGYSRLSDNGKYGVKLSLGANTQGNVGAGAGVAYFW